MMVGYVRAKVYCVQQTIAILVTTATSVLLLLLAHTLTLFPLDKDIFITMMVYHVTKSSGNRVIEHTLHNFK